MRRVDRDLQGVVCKAGRLQSISIRTQEVCAICLLQIGVRRKARNLGETETERGTSTHLDNCQSYVQKLEDQQVDLHSENMSEPLSASADGGEVTTR